jgi:hypothetical protein
VCVCVFVCVCVCMNINSLTLSHEERGETIPQRRDAAFLHRGVGQRLREGLAVGYHADAVMCVCVCVSVSE